MKLDHGSFHVGLVRGEVDGLRERFKNIRDAHSGTAPDWTATRLQVFSAWHHWSRLEYQFRGTKVEATALALTWLFSRAFPAALGTDPEPERARHILAFALDEALSTVAELSTQLVLMEADHVAPGSPSASGARATMS